MKKLAGLLKRTFIPSTPEDSPRTAVNWLIAFAPFILQGLWHSGWQWQFWLWIPAAAMWTWNITYAFVNRFYYRLFKSQNDSLMELAKSMQAEYWLLHDHCPQCGLRLKPPQSTEVPQ